MKYLQRDHVIRAVLHNEGQAAVAAVQELPTLDLVQCRDCIFYQSSHNDRNGVCVRTINKVRQWDFCSLAKRNGIEVRE